MCNPYHMAFPRFFRQHLGITPTEYRRAVNLFEPPAGAGLDHPPVI